jgi:hypothetical protein
MYIYIHTCVYLYKFIHINILSLFIYRHISILPSILDNESSCNKNENDDDNDYHNKCIEYYKLIIFRFAVICSSQNNGNMDIIMIQNLLDNFVPENLSYSCSPLKNEETRSILAVMNTLHLLAVKSWSYIDILSNRLKTRDISIRSVNSSGNDD